MPPYITMPRRTSRDFSHVLALGGTAVVTAVAGALICVLREARRTLAGLAPAVHSPGAEGQSTESPRGLQAFPALTGSSRATLPQKRGPTRWRIPKRKSDARSPNFRSSFLRSSGRSRPVPSMKRTPAQQGGLAHHRRHRAAQRGSPPASEDARLPAGRRRRGRPNKVAQDRRLAENAAVLSQHTGVAA
jgi:hypothetical protein